MNEGVQVDESLHTDLQEIIRENESQVSSPAPDSNSFQHLFWTQQKSCIILQQPLNEMAPIVYQVVLVHQASVK